MLLSVMKFWLGRHRRLLVAVAGSVAGLLVAVFAAGYLTVRHFNDNLTQVNLAGLVGQQAAGAQSRSENILVIGNDSGVNGASEVTTDEPDTIMVLHIAADKKSASVLSIPRDSYVRIPACPTGGGAMSAPVQARIGAAFAVGAQSGNRTALGAACLIRTVQRDTGLNIDHFVMVNLNGFQAMVDAFGGVEQCVPAGLVDPNSGTALRSGCRVLDGAQALAYVRARAGTGAHYSDDLARIGREQALVTALFAKAKTKLLDPAALYRFLNAATRSLTVDSQLGGLNGLRSLESTLHGIPSGKIIQLTLPTRPRSSVLPSQLLWKQPQASEIFSAIRADKAVSPALVG